MANLYKTCRKLRSKILVCYRSHACDQKEPRLEKLPHRRGKCVSQQEGNRRAICSSSVKIPALGQDLAWFCLGESQGLRKLLTLLSWGGGNV